MNQTVRERVRCSAIKKDGSRCKNFTIKYADFCWIHTKLKSHLQVRVSNIPGAGQGLFAVNDLKEGTVIRYGREPEDSRTKEEIDKQYEDLAEYAMCNATNTKCYDAASTQSGLARWINSARNSGHAANVRLMVRKYGGQWRGYAKTLRNIRAGSELYANYGVNYFAR